MLNSTVAQIMQEIRKLFLNFCIISVNVCLMAEVFKAGRCCTFAESLVFCNRSACLKGINLLGCEETVHDKMMWTECSINTYIENTRFE